MHGTPDLEVVDLPRASLSVWSHGYPFRTVRWHFHPEYEIHLVTATTGRAFIGDYVGSFAPGNLVMIGPNLPHNWISDVAKGETVAERCIVVQFSAGFIRGCIGLMPELAGLEALLARAASGIEFAAGTGAAARPVIEALRDSSGPARIGYFFRLLGLLLQAEGRPLASEAYRPCPEAYAVEPLNHVIDYVARNLAEDLTQTDLAALSGFSPSAFSRAFKRHTGQTFVRYVNRLRINRACDLLMTGEASVADICYGVGFNNLSNFTRHFQALKGMPPSAFRREHRRNSAPRH